MKLSRTSGTLGAATLTVVVASPFASADDASWYVGANIGLSRANIDVDEITRGLLAGGFVTASIADDDHDSGHELFVGYQFNENFALQGGYFDLGTFGFTASTVPAGTLSGSIELKGVNLDAVGRVPLTEKFSAFGRVAVSYAEAKDSFTGTGFVSVLDPDRSKRAANYKLGLGLQYDFTASFGMRAEAQRYRIDDAVGNQGDLDLFSVGLVYRFGRQTSAFTASAAPGAVMAAPTPMYVAGQQSSSSQEGQKVAGGDTRNSDLRPQTLSSKREWPTPLIRSIRAPPGALRREDTHHPRSRGRDGHDGCPRVVCSIRPMTAATETDQNFTRAPKL